MAPSAGLSDLSPLVAATAAADTAPSVRNAMRRAKLLVVFVCLALLATNAWLIVAARTHALDLARQSDTKLARAVTDQLESLVSEADHILDSLVDGLERSELSAVALEHLQPVLVSHVARTPQLLSLYVLNPLGDWLSSSEPVWAPGGNASDRPYFIHHRDNPSGSTLLGPPITSRSTGEWVVPVSRRLNDADGDFAGVVLATISVHYLRGLLERFDVGEGAMLLTLSGRMVARHPFLPSGIGEPLPPSPARTLMESQREGHAETDSPLDGVTRLFSFEHARSYPLQVSVASSKRQVLANWRQSSVLQTVWVLFLCLLLERAGSYTRRAIHQRQLAERGLRAARDALTQANERLAQLARIDELTRLPNRRAFDRRLTGLFRQAQREHSPLAIVMVDVDDFKKYNDHYGHVEGDECLRRVAAALRATLKRPEDFVARYGGEEMALLLPGTDALGATLVAEAARVAVASMDIPHAAVVAGKVSISLGVAAAVPGPQDGEQALLKAADAALYAAKRQGRNRVVCS